MGCDIHVLLEKQDSKNNWRNVDYWQYNYYEDEPKFDLIEFYWHRNYELFTVLANVRNYDDIVNYISEPKGIPDNCSKETQDYIDRWGCDGHSHSYYTLKELYDYWIKMSLKIKRRGILIGDVLEKFDKEGIEPDEWCRGTTTMQKHAWREWEAEYNCLDEFMNAFIDRFCKEFWIMNIKKEEYKTSEKFKEFVDKYGDKFRVVFFFDN